MYGGVSARMRVRALVGPRCDETCRFIPRLSPRVLQRLIGAADLVVLPSLYENFSYVCLEAMAQAKPVLATRGTGFDEILTDERTGFLVAPGDAAELADALSRLAPDAQRLTAVGQNARRSLVRFDANRIVARLCAAYTQ
jgi:glycosyltransferase involved in cell wall biosynthesis